MFSYQLGPFHLPINFHANFGLLESFPNSQ
jgi:hypothetical protein